MAANGYLIRLEGTEFFVPDAAFNNQIRPQLLALLRQHGQQLQPADNLQPDLQTIRDLLNPGVGIWPMKR